MAAATLDVVDDLLDGDQRAIARAISVVENRSPGYRELVSELHRHATDAPVLGVTGSPGSGKSTLVTRVVEELRDRGETVGVIAVDPSSPYTGGAVLGDRVRMSRALGDDGVFVRSMSARGALGGLSTATVDAITALDAAGYDRIIVETVGAGQNEVDVVRRADTVAVLVPPGSGDDVQMLKAGILEIGDVFVVNKADLDGADRTVRDLQEMIRERDLEGSWTPPVVETVATEGEGVGSVLDEVDAHLAHLEETGERERRLRERAAADIRSLLREDVNALVERRVQAAGGMDSLVDRVRDREADRYEVADELLADLRDAAGESGHNG